jgi:hypothetical protein
MVNFIVVIITSLVLTACGSEFTKEMLNSIDMHNPGVNGAFREHVAKFEELSGINVTLSIQFEPQLKRNLAGVCKKYWNDKRVIVISREVWDYIADAFNPDEAHGLHELIVFHELGHCVFGWGHNSTMTTRYEALPLGGFLSYSSPESLMYPSLFLNYHKHREDYRKEVTLSQPIGGSLPVYSLDDSFHDHGDCVEEVEEAGEDE